MNARSTRGNSPEEIKTALTKSMADGFIPTLAFVFIFIKNEIEGVRKAFNVPWQAFLPMVNLAELKMETTNFITAPVVGLH